MLRTTGMILLSAGRFSSSANMAAVFSKAPKLKSFHGMRSSMHYSLRRMLSTTPPLATEVPGTKAAVVPQKLKKKDLNAPKNARSARTFFAVDIRQVIRDETPDIKLEDITKQIGERWKNLSPEDKAPFARMATADKVRYKSAMIAYKKKKIAAGEDVSDLVIPEEKPDKKKKKKDKNAPKKNRSAYIFFGSSERPAIKADKPELSAPDTIKELAARWKALPAADKIPFEELAAADKVRYEADMAEYERKMVAAGIMKDPAAPKGPKSAYIFFGSVIRPTIKNEISGISPTETMREIGVRWKALSASDKALYEERATADKARYVDELKAFQAKIA